MSRIESEAELDALYGAPSPNSLHKQTDRLTDGYRALIAASPFFALASVGPEGLDCSPRGERQDGVPQAIHIEDDRTLMIPDRRGNNRVDSLRNIVRDPRVALLFLIPGSGITMRVTGQAQVRIDADLLARFAVDGKAPRSVILITVQHAYFQCARAILRADLWSPDHHGDAAALPSAGTLLQEITRDQATAETVDAAHYDADWQMRAPKTFW